MIEKNRKQRKQIINVKIFVKPPLQKLVVYETMRWTDSFSLYSGSFTGSDINTLRA